MTRRSRREPNLKEEEVGEGSSPGVARKLEFVTKAEPVIICWITERGGESVIT
jgi:hypothetical protein